MPKLVVGLGNPGPTYAATRHNIGFRCLAELAARHGLRFGRSRFQAELATGSIAGQSTVLACPQTYMNESGRAVAELCRYYSIADDELLIVLDDLDLPFGQLRLRPTGSSGGHRGLESIIQHRRERRIPRLRIGIGRPPESLAVERYVLLPFLPAEQTQLPLILATAAAALECWLSEGLTATMTRYNGWAPPSGP